MYFITPSLHLLTYGHNEWEKWKGKLRQQQTYCNIQTYKQSIIFKYIHIFTIPIMNSSFDIYARFLYYLVPKKG